MIVLDIIESRPNYGKTGGISVSTDNEKVSALFYYFMLKLLLF